MTNLYARAVFFVENAEASLRFYVEQLGFSEDWAHQEEETSIQKLIARVLERQGHRVITCGDSAEALAVADPIDLLIVDFVLPNMNGRDLTAELRKTHPALPVVLMSGYLPSPDLAPPLPSTFMQKPMQTTVIVETVQRMLTWGPEDLKT